MTTYQDTEEGTNIPENPRQRCQALCSCLDAKFPQLVSYEGQAAYTLEQNYWSQQQANTKPVCRFTPTSAEDVSVAIKEIRDYECPFAVKSGGHASFQGASNVAGGITIDLHRLNEINVSADRNVTHTGTGNRWEDVYSKLDPMDLAVIGGRNGDIGVGGLPLGGGISFFSGFHGWACDNILNYQVVLADGQIVNANETSHADLYFALRGGGNNFGVVTRMDLQTFDQGLMWGGSTVYSLDKNSSLYDAFYWFNVNAKEDPNAALIVSAACIKALGSCIFSNNYNYIQPEVNPPVFHNFTRVQNVTSTQRISKLLDFTNELKATQPNGYRQAFFSITLLNDAQIMKDILNDVWYPAVQPLLKVEGFLGTLVFQVITDPIIEKFGKAGGNALGITADQGPLTVLNMDFQWNSTADDDQVLGIEKTIVEKATALAKSRGLFHRYIYQNYAYVTQDVFEGYGPESKAKLLKVQRDYDLEHVFVDLQPGYFKLRR
ncbi:hypothetical protein PRZ48_011305 [Zasmidium cellare]|uniref:FAD-binding PCMH-type domain-containing protein n=1 Tax=Zasmidium cellare TaxID=395010 RepID=A0ABR0E6L1_ZASCE|nr:hypothetical protein PRZ48_011305 [Zasmidium cellare]